jgi:tRNA (guanine26-N2/guanine27-N2)-dimethyltransferase
LIFGVVHLEEEGISFEGGSSFYNPHMRLCRSFSSLLVGTLQENLSILDGFCASGIRGIRYAKENENVSALDFLDISPEAVGLSKKNAEKNGIGAKSRGTKSNSHEAEFNSFLMDAGKREGGDSREGQAGGSPQAYDFIELDPFGSPAPYAYHAMRAFRNAKGGFLSITATDTAVLCGAHPHACKRVYHSFPLHDEILHEAGVRILWKYVSNIANEFNFGIEPLATLSHRHFFKIFLRLEKGSKSALDSFSRTGYLTFCPHCGSRQAGKMGLEICPKCAKRPKICGPLWLGELHDAPTLKKMRKLNSEREYSERGKLDSLLGLMEGEVGMPPWFYEVHATCRRLKIQPPPKMERLMGNLHDAGFAAVRTHFSPLGVKTDAGVCELGRALKGRLQES